MSITTDPAIIRGTYSDLKVIKTRKVLQMVIEVPLEEGGQLVDIFGLPQPAEEIPVAVARLDPDGPGSANGRPSDFGSEDEGSNPSPGAKPKSYAQRAAMLSRDPVFWRFMAESDDWDEITDATFRDIYVTGDVHNTDIAAQAIRDWCGVSSRAQIYDKTEAYDRFRDLTARFSAWKALT